MSNSFQTPKQRARVRIIEALYQWQLFAKESNIEEIIQSALAQKKSKISVHFFKETLLGIITNFERLTNDIQTHINHSIKEVSPIDLAILYLGSYELMQKDLSKKIIINEAVELAKRYGTEKADKFVNHILDVLSKQYKQENK